METKPLSADTWDDWLAVMGPHGGDAGCWCLWYRVTGREFGSFTSEERRGRMRELVDRGEVPGLIGYRDGRPVGWVQVCPRAPLGRLDRSKVARSPDGRDAWAITCIVVPKEHRRTGVGTDLVTAAVDHAIASGATLVEAWPVEPRDGKTEDHWAWMGIRSMFNGFTEIARPTETRPYLRLEP